MIFNDAEAFWNYALDLPLTSYYAMFYILGNV